MNVNLYVKEYLFLASHRFFPQKLIIINNTLNSIKTFLVKLYFKKFKIFKTSVKINFIQKKMYPVIR